MQAKLAMVDHKAHRYPDQPRVPRVGRRALEERRWRLARLQTAREVEEGMPPTPKIPGVSALDGFPALRGPEVTRASAYSTMCVTSAEAHGVTLKWGSRWNSSEPAQSFPS